MIISLSGLPGAGKSTVKALLAQQLNLKSYSMGDMRGKMALDRGMTIDEFNELGMTESFTDHEVDAYQETLGRTEDDFIIDAWLSWHFIPHSFKVFLTIDPQIAAQRIFASRQQESGREDEPEYETVEETRETLAKRVAQNQERYQKWYKIDFLDMSHYDFILDTTNLTPQEVAERILAAAPKNA